MGTANLFSSNWDTAVGTAATCLGDAADPLTDSFRWTEYGPGSNAVCDAVPPIAKLSMATVHSVGKSLQVHFKIGDGANGPDFRMATNFSPEKTELWLSWWQFWDSNWWWAGADHKLIILGSNSSPSQDTYLNVRGNGGGSQSGRFVVGNQTEDTVFRDVGTAGDFAVNTWNHFEAHIISGVNGRVELKLNGVQLNLTLEAGSGRSNPNTQNTGPSIGYLRLDTTYNDFAAFESHIVGTSSNTYYDDVGVGTTGWIGAVTPPAGSGRGALWLY